MSEDEDETSNTKRSRVEKEEKEEDAMFSASESSVDFDSSQEDDDDDDDDDDDAGNEYGDGFGDDLMGDMDDRKRLWALTEVERSYIGGTSNETRSIYGKQKTSKRTCKG